jgi:hypothetical protein
LLVQYASVRAEPFQESNMSIIRMIPAAALAACCVAAPTFAQTPTPASPQTQPPAESQPTPTPRTQTPAPVVQPATGTQPATTPAITPAQPMTPGTSTRTGTSSIADTEHGTAILLLDRVQKVLDKAADDAKGGQVTIDRGLLDEVRAEVAKVKQSLQAEKR